MTDEPREVDVFVAKHTRRAIVPDNTDAFALKGEALRELKGLDNTTRKRMTRGLDKAFTGADGSKSKQLSEFDTIDAYNLFGVVLPPYNLDYLAKIYEMSSPHYAAVKVKVANITGLGFDFVETAVARRKMDEGKTEAAKKKMRKNIDAEKENLYTWLDECNEEDEFTETLGKVWTDYESMGNGFLEVGRGLDGTVKYIGHIPASTMRVRRERDGFVQIVANRAVFFRNFGDKKTPDRIGGDAMPNEVIHFKKYSPTNTYYGVPDIIAAQQAVVGNEFSARFNLDYFENKAVPRYVIVLKGANFSETAQANLLEFFETGLKGQNHRTLFVPLPPDDTEQKVEFEMKPVEAGTQDASFINYRNGNLQEILMAHRVPISKVTTADSASLAAARDADKTFKETVCRPEQAMLEKKLNRIVKEVTEVVKLKLNELALSDEDTLSQMDERYLRMKVMVPNDIRVRRWGWEAVEGGDKVVELKPEVAAEQRTQASGNRAKDRERSANSPDKQGEARQPKGEGRATA